MGCLASHIIIWHQNVTVLFVDCNWSATKETVSTIIYHINFVIYWLTGPSRKYQDLHYRFFSCMYTCSLINQFHPPLPFGFSQANLAGHRFAAFPPFDVQKGCKFEIDNIMASYKMRHSWFLVQFSHSYWYDVNKLSIVIGCRTTRQLPVNTTRCWLDVERTEKDSLCK